MRILSLRIALLVGLSTASHAQNGGYTYTTIDPPGANNTTPLAINASGQIAGAYDTHGFVYSNRVFTTIDVPGASSTQALAISDSGTVFGTYEVPPPSSGCLPPDFCFQLQGLFQYNLGTGALTTSTFNLSPRGSTDVFAISPTGALLAVGIRLSKRIRS